MNTSLLLLVVSLLVVVGATPHNNKYKDKDKDDFSVVLQNIYYTLVPNDLNSLYTEAKEFSSSMNSGGYWSDINYTDPNIVVWPAATHLSPRLLKMATAYIVPGQPLYLNTQLFKNINLALNFWLSKDFTNANWWWNQISVPISISEITFLLKNNVTETQKETIFTIIDRADYLQWTGANLVWMATAFIYKGAATNNETCLRNALDAIYSIVVISNGTADGIKQDGSFYQHGQLIYNGGYGFEFVTYILPFLNMTLNTSFYINEESLDVFSLLVLNGSQWMIMGKMWDYVVIGRGETRDESFIEQFNPSILATVPGKRHNEFVSFANGLLGLGPSIVGNRNFWKADYMVHKRRGYSASVRMYSTRMYNSECLNGEGLKNLHVADGVFNIYQTGYEFDKIYPTWDWEKIPGTTCALGELPFECSTLKVHGKTTFVGGVSDGIYGAAAFDFASALNGTLTAKKSWYFFDDQIVALGADIKCGCKFPIITSINQCLLKDFDFHTYSSNNPTTPLPIGAYSFDNITWVYHDGVGYIVGGWGSRRVSVGLSLMQQSGDWQDIGAYTGYENKSVFNFWLNQQDIGDTYTYIVVPNITLVDFINSVNSTLRTTQVINNDHTIQAIFNEELGILQVVFWEAGIFTLKSHNLIISSDSSSIIMLKMTNSQMTFYVADPTHLLSSIVIKVNMNMKGEKCENEGDSTVLKFDLPSGEFAGESISIACSI